MKKWLAVLCLISGVAFGQSAQPFWSPMQTFFDQSGNPCSGCSLYTYQAGTTTPQPTYSGSSGAVQNTNPVILNAAGAAQIWVGASAYKFILFNTSGTQIWTADNILAPTPGGGIQYLPLTGGTLTGPLTAPTYNLIAGRGIYGPATAASYITDDNTGTGGWNIGMGTSSTFGIRFWSGSAGTTLLAQIDGSGNFTAKTGNFTGGSFAGTYTGSPTFTGTVTVTNPINGSITGNAATATSAATANTANSATTANTANTIATNGSANQVWGMNGAGTTQGWQNITSSIPTIQHIQITTGICTASGASYNTCSMSAVNWPTAFSSANYALQCFGLNPSNGSGPSGSISGSIYSATKTSTSVTISLQTVTSSGFSYGEIDCTGTL